MVASGGGVDAVVERLDLPVDVDVTAERLPPGDRGQRLLRPRRGPDERGQALTGCPRRGHRVGGRNGVLDVQIRDNGIGGADPTGHGLLGMKDRVTALGGRLEIASAAGRGTCVAATLPLPQRL